MGSHWGRDSDNEIPIYKDYMKVVKHVKIKKVIGLDQGNNEMIKQGGREFMKKVFGF